MSQQENNKRKVLEVLKKKIDVIIEKAQNMQLETQKHLVFPMIYERLLHRFDKLSSHKSLDPAVFKQMEQLWQNVGPEPYELLDELEGYQRVTLEQKNTFEECYRGVLSPSHQVRSFDESAYYLQKAQHAVDLAFHALISSQGLYYELRQRHLFLKLLEKKIEDFEEKLENASSGCSVAPAFALAI